MLKAMPQSGSSSRRQSRRPIADQRRRDADVAGEDASQEGPASNKSNAISLEAEASGARLFAVIERLEKPGELCPVIDPVRPDVHRVLFRLIGSRHHPSRWRARHGQIPFSVRDAAHVTRLEAALTLGRIYGR